MQAVVFSYFLLSAGHTGPVCGHIPATARASVTAGHCRDILSYIISEQTELGNHFDFLLWHLCTVQMLCHERKPWRRAIHLSRVFSIAEGWSRPPGAGTQGVNDERKVLLVCADLKKRSIAVLKTIVDSLPQIGVRLRHDFYGFPGHCGLLRPSCPELFFR